MHLSDLVGTLNPECPDCQLMVRAWLPSQAERRHPSVFNGWMLELDRESLDEAVRLSVAAAARCWIPAPTGEYQQELAGQIAEELITHIRKIFY